MAPLRSIVEVAGGATFTDCLFANNEPGLDVGLFSVVVELSDTATVAFTDCFFIDNSGGGVVWCTESSSAILLNCEFSGNNSAFTFAEGDFSPSSTLSGCTFSGNSGIAEGGGLFMTNGSVTNCTITGNRSVQGGGGIYVKGDATVTDCEIIGNRTDNLGGGILVGGGSPTITNCTITGDTADVSGGGVGIYDGTPTFTDCTITENFADSLGGGVYVYGLTLSSAFANCTISGNSAENGGGVGLLGLMGGLFEFTNCEIVGNIASSVGGGFCVEGLAATSAALTGCTIAGNMSVGDGGGIAVLGPIYAPDSTIASATRTVVWGNCASGSGDEVFTDVISGTGAVYFTCCDVDTSGVEGSGAAIYVSDNISKDPDFCAPESCNNAPTTAGDYTLAANSPCIPSNSPCGQLIGSLGVGCSSGEILSITDVGNDQGRQVRVKWARDLRDVPGSPTPITQYSLWRKVVPGYLSSAQRNLPPVELLSPPGDWDFVETIPALGYPTYSTVAPTLCDSTVLSGVCWSTFYVVAHTATPTVFFEGAPDSGYSVDNLAPAVPQGFAVAYNAGSNVLTWDPSEDNDFQFFRIYRSDNPDLTVSDPPFNYSWEVAHTTVGTNWTDTSDQAWRYRYQIRAVDHAGNESDAAGPGAVTGVTEPAVPKTVALYQNSPNPFNPTTVIRYDVPAGGGKVSIRIYDVGGRLIHTLVDGNVTPGRKSATWNAKDAHGNPVSSGIYFFRLSAGSTTLTKKMILLK